MTGVCAELHNHPSEFMKGLCVCVCAAGVCAELHDHPSRPGRPAAGYCGGQGEAGVGGEEERADHRECSEPEAA